MDLSVYDGKTVRIKTVWGEIFEGEAVHDSEEYCEHEYGWAEESLNLNHWLFRRSDIESVELLEGKPRIWMSRRMHFMHLDHPAYGRMEDGLKTLELRLNDPKRREIQVGDIICFEGVEGEALLLLLDDKGIAASSGSACTSGSLDPSHVLLAIGRVHDVAHGALRLTPGENTTDEEVDYIIQSVKDVVQYLRSFSPVWRDLSNGKIQHIL